MLNATSEIEFEFLTKFLNMSKLQIRQILLYPRVPLQYIVFCAMSAERSTKFAEFHKMIMDECWVVRDEFPNDISHGFS